MAAVVDYLATAPDGVLAWQQGQAKMLHGRWQARAAGGPLYIELAGGPVAQLSTRIELTAAREGCLARIDAAYSPLPGQRTQQAAQLAEGLIAGLGMSLRALSESAPPARLNRRRSQRTPLVRPVQLRVGPTVWAGSTTDVSTDGIGIHLPEDISTETLGAALQGHASGALQIDLGHGWITARVQLIRQTPTRDGYTIGLRFAQPGEVARLHAHLTTGQITPRPRQGTDYRTLATRPEMRVHAHAGSQR